LHASPSLLVHLQTEIVQNRTLPNKSFHHHEANGPTNHFEWLWTEGADDGWSLRKTVRESHFLENLVSLSSLLAHCLVWIFFFGTTKEIWRSNLWRSGAVAK
jgi:hypothetical protein